MSRTKSAINPLEFMALKTRVGHEKADELALPTLLYLDSAKRGMGSLAAENALVRTVVIAQVIGSKSGTRAFYDCACRAGVQLAKAAGRGADLLALTTGEYSALRHMVASYLRILPTLQIQMLAYSHMQAERLIMEMAGENI